MNFRCVLRPFHPNICKKLHVMFHLIYLHHRSFLKPGRPRHRPVREHQQDTLRALGAGGNSAFRLTQFQSTCTELGPSLVRFHVETSSTPNQMELNKATSQGDKGSITPLGYCFQSSLFCFPVTEISETDRTLQTTLFHSSLHTFRSISFLHSYLHVM